MIFRPHGWLPFLLALLICAPLSAELTIFYVAADLTETPVGNRIVMPEVPAGDFADLRLRVRNTGTEGDNVNSFLVRGAGFSLLTVPSLPWLLAPGLNLDVRLRFSPTGSGSYSGTLLLNGTQVLVTGRSPEAAALWVQAAAGWQMVSNTQEIDFGRILSNTRSTFHFAFRNPGTSSVTVSSMILSPGPFALVAPPSMPLTVAAAGEAAFDIEFAPTRGGVFRAPLLIDGRTITLAGNAFEPPLPEPLLSFGPTDFSSGQQQSLQIRFAEPARGNGTMKLTLEFTPVQGSPDDAAIQFLANSSRVISFPVRPGDQGLSWNGDPKILFQTGTTAGLIRFTVAFDSDKRMIDFPIASAPPHLESAILQRTNASIVLRMTGFDNARSISTLSFTWYHVDGSVIGGGAVVSQLGTPFSNYFKNSVLGGIFSVTASFPVSGSPENVVGLEIEATNGAGSTRSKRVSF